jgi:putative membrane protein
MGKKQWPLYVMIAVFAVYWVFMAARPTDRMQWLMENVLLISVVLVLFFTYKKFRFSQLSYLFIFIFLCFHTYGAHYTYQGTPFDIWLKTAFHTHRSYYDRVVHLLFGLLWAYPAREWLTRTGSVRGLWSYAIPVAIVFGFSAFFEIIEMGAAYVAGQVGEEYVGLQGDVYDSQKDMGLGLAGALIAMMLLGWKRKPGKTKLVH